MSATSHRHGSIYSSLQELHGLVVPGTGDGILGEKTGIVHLLANGLKVNRQYIFYKTKFLFSTAGVIFNLPQYTQVHFSEVNTEINVHLYYFS